MFYFGFLAKMKNPFLLLYEHPLSVVATANADQCFQYDVLKFWPQLKKYSLFLH